jgi:hypothetical protein
MGIALNAASERRSRAQIGSLCAGLTRAGSGGRRTAPSPDRTLTSMHQDGRARPSLAQTHKRTISAGHGVAAGQPMGE